MTTTSRLDLFQPIQKFGSSSFSFFIYKYGVRLVDFFDPCIEAVSESGPYVSQSFALEQNYPNPFNPTTTLHFRLPATSTVTLRVFDMLGRAVLTALDRQTLDAGEHAVHFNGSILPSGAYVYELEVTGVGRSTSFHSARKMMLIK